MVMTNSLALLLRFLLPILLSTMLFSLAVSPSIALELRDPNNLRIDRNLLALSSLVLVTVLSFRFLTTRRSRTS